MAIKRPNPRKRNRAKKLTPKDVGLVPGVCLSITYPNTKQDFKTVDSHTMGYVVMGGGNSPARIAPIYSATIFQRIGKKTYITASHEIGEYFNQPHPETEAPDIVGDEMAYTAMIAVRMIEQYGNRKRYAERHDKENS